MWHKTQRLVKDLNPFKRGANNWVNNAVRAIGRGLTKIYRKMTVSKLDKDGYFKDPKITKHPVPEANQGKWPAGVEYIIVHRTGSPVYRTNKDGSKEPNGPESNFVEFARDREGTHFLIDGYGDIYQTSSLNNKTGHTGTNEYNNNSIGIEIIGAYDKVKKEWEPVTKEQLESAAHLIKTLQDHYMLGKDRVIGHEDVFPMTPNEGKLTIRQIQHLLRE